MTAGILWSSARCQGAIHRNLADTMGTLGHSAFCISKFLGLQVSQRAHDIFRGLTCSSPQVLVMQPARDIQAVWPIRYSKRLSSADGP